MVKIKKRIDALRAQIEYHNNLYYNLDSPEITDGEYDALMRELRDLEREFPEYDNIDSPTKRVGGAANVAFAPVKHKVKMLSLNDVFLLRHEPGSKEESIERFIDGAAKTESTREAKGIRKKLQEDVQFVVEPKIDGVAVSLEYINGKFVRGSTRGNGEIGEDVTHNLKTISDIPQKLPVQLGYLAVRGEVYLSHESFAKFEGKFANPRNAAAGSLRQKDSLQAELRALSFIAFNIQQIRGKEIETHFEALEFLKDMGFKIPPESELLSDTDKIIKKIETLGEKRKELGFDMDGAVVKVNNLAQREALGATAKVPLWAVAYKYAAEQQTTKLREIVLQIGRTGVLTPNAVLDEVTLAGTKVSRATLHNMDMIAKKDIRVGDMVIIQKAGEIIPEVVGSVKEKRDGSEVVYEAPKACPFCNGDVIRDEEEVAYRCVNAGCSAQKERQITHFASRDAMDIEGLGDSFIKALIAKKWVDKVSDLYTLTPIDIFTNFPGMQRKNAEKLVEGINRSKESGLARLLYGLGIRNLGLNTAKMLAEEFGNMDALINATEQQIKDIKGVKDALYKSIREYLENNMDLINELKLHGIKMTK